MPGICASFGASSWMIWFAFNLRSEAGFKRMNMRPLFSAGGRAAGADGGHETVHVRVGGDNFARGHLVLLHGVKGNVLRRLGDGKNLAGVLIWGKSPWE